MSDQPLAVEAIITAAREHASPHIIDPTKAEVAVFVVPEGSRVEKVQRDESYLDKPRRTKGSVTVEDLPSLQAYIAEHYDAGRTTVWVHVAQHQVTAVLDDDDAQLAAWRDHRATLALVKTPEWIRWRRLDGTLMGQEQFAEHIEESELDIVSPDAATMLEIAQTFQTTTNAEFRQGTRLQSGDISFTWVKEENAKAGRKGELEIPATFTLAIAPFEGEDKTPIDARLRFRVNDGALRIGYKLVRPDEFERETMLVIASALREDVARVYLGSPAGAR